MHEVSLVEALMARVGEEARARHAVSVHRVHVRIGELSGVEPELLRSAFQLLRAGTPCDGAELLIARQPASWRCPACATTLAPGDPLQCPVCGAPATLTQGDEISIERLELQVPDV